MSSWAKQSMSSWAKSNIWNMKLQKIDKWPKPKFDVYIMYLCHVAFNQKNFQNFWVRISSIISDQKFRKNSFQVVLNVKYDFFSNLRMEYLKCNIVQGCPK